MPKSAKVVMDELESLIMGDIPGGVAVHEPSYVRTTYVPVTVTRNSDVVVGSHKATVQVTVDLSAPATSEKVLIVSPINLLITIIPPVPTKG